MNEWWRHLKGRPFYWALDGTHPAVDLFMLRHVVGRPDRSPVVRRARLALVESQLVESLTRDLAAGAPSGWAPRYGSPFWILRLLAELGVPGDDEQIASALDRVLDETAPGQEDVDRPAHLDALVAHNALALGYGEDERAQAVLARLRDTLVSGTLPGEPRQRADWLVLVAQALAALPAGSRDESMLSALLAYLEELQPASLPDYGAYRFPTFDQPDDLVLARSALLLGLRGDWLRPWVERVVAAQDDQGLWRLGRALPIPGGITVEQEGQPSRWLTAQALFILREFYGE
jgi:hypothetical protein